VAVKIRLMRMGKIRNPQYRIVVADARTKRDGRAIEYVGIYHPKEHPSLIEVKSDRVQYWLSVGAQPSEPVQRILEKTGDWQKFKGLPAPPPLLVAPERASRQATYEAEAKAAAGVADTPAKPAKKATKSAATETRAEPRAAAETKPEPKAAAETKPEPKAAAEPAAAPEAATEAQNEPEAAPEAQAEPEAAPEGQAEPKAAPEAQVEPKVAAAPEAAEAKPALTRPADPAAPNREAVAETAEDPAGAGADAS
jgi:small subunit ribosomal protein S16